MACTRVLITALAGLLHAAAATAQERVDLELVLAVDVSRSMDLEEQVIQRDGYAEAFRHPDVTKAITNGMTGRIAVTYIEWAGSGVEETIVPWTIISNREESFAFAALLNGEPAVRLSGTSISAALRYAADLIESNQIEGTRRVIDVSGDGPNNDGAPVEPARDAVLARGISINGLPIMLRPGGNFLSIGQLDIYYEDCVIGGQGAFVVPVRAAEEFPSAIRRKLILEIAGRKPQVVFAAEKVRERPKMGCLIGERLRQLRMNN